ncbi:hypothetical protein ACFXGR_27345, partial [Streptomyces mirabilis]
GEYLLGGATSSSFPCSGQPYWVPVRKPRGPSPPAVRLAPGQWLQWQINYRFVGSCDGAWSYQLETFNILYGSAAPDVFLSVPTRRVDERGALR